MKNNLQNITFTDAFERVKQATEIKNITQLADFLGISQPAVSNAKKKNSFPVEWAISLEVKFGILTRWTLTGAGPERLPSPHENRDLPAYLADLAKWADEISGSEDREWLKRQIDILFPAFKAWREQRKSGTEKAPIHQDQINERKVA